MIRLPDTVTHWTVSPDNHGGFTFSAPTQLSAVWQDRIEKLVTPQGEEFISKASVWLEVDVITGDYLFQGASVAVDPTTLALAYRVQMFSKVHDLNGNKYERKATL